MALIPLTAGCIAVAAMAFGHSEGALRAIMKVEGGQVGTVSKPNKNGTVDIGPFQINQIWVPTFQKMLGHKTPEETFARLRDDGCFNALAAAYVLKQTTMKAGDPLTGVGHYHSRTPEHMRVYQQKFLKAYGEVSVNPGR